MATMLGKRQVRCRVVRYAVLVVVAVCSAVLVAQNRDLPPEPGPTTVGQLGVSQPTFHGCDAGVNGRRRSG